MSEIKRQINLYLQLLHIHNKKNRCSVICKAIQEDPTEIQMFKRFTLIKRRNLDRFRCYATPLQKYHSNGDTALNGVRPVENRERPLDLAYNVSQSQYRLKDIVNRNQHPFLSTLAENPWNMKFHHSKYTISGTETMKLTLTDTETRNSTEIHELFNQAIDSSQQYAVGVNLSSNVGQKSAPINFVVLDIDPPKDSKWHPLEGQVLKLIIDYYINELDTNRTLISESKYENITIPFIVKTPRGLHIMFRADPFQYQNKVNKKYQRDRRLLKLLVSAEYIVSGNINLFGWPYEILLCPSSFQNLAYLPDFLTPGEILQKLKGSDLQPIDDFIRKGNRNQTLFTISCKSKTLTLDTLMRINKYFCEEPLKDDEVVKIYESSMKYRQTGIVVANPQDSTVSLHENIKNALVKYGEIPENAKDDHQITAGAVMRTALQCGTAKEGAGLVGCLKNR